MTAPETLEERLRALAAKWEAEADDLDATDLPAYEWRAAVRRDCAGQVRALLPPAPEPIKVGDRVLPDDGDNRIPGEVLAIGTYRYFVRRDDDREVCWTKAGVVRVDSSPSPEPEPDVVLPRQPLRNSRTYTATADPAPSPSPEVGEGWRQPVDMAEANTAWEAGVIEWRPDDRSPWQSVPARPSVLSYPTPAGTRFYDVNRFRLPLGWGGAS